MSQLGLKKCAETNGSANKLTTQISRSHMSPHPSIMISSLSGVQKYLMRS